MSGRLIVGISATNRAASGIPEGDVVEVGLRLDAEPRVVAEPPDLADALDRAPRARAAFDQLPYGLKRKHVQAIEDAQSPRRGSGASPSYHHDRRRPRCLALRHRARRPSARLPAHHVLAAPQSPLRVSRTLTSRT